MPDDLRVTVPNRPGSALATVDVLAKANINIEGFCGDIRPGERWGHMHFLVDDGARAGKLLEEAGVEVTSWHKVDLIELENKPGALAEVLREHREAGRNVEVLYATSDERVVIATEDMREDVSGVRVKDA